MNITVNQLKKIINQIINEQVTGDKEGYFDGSFYSEEDDDLNTRPHNGGNDVISDDDPNNPNYWNPGLLGHLRESIKLTIIESLEEAKKYKGKSMRKGGGGRFAKLVDKLKSSGKSEESAKAIAASVGRKKYGTKEMARMAKAGKKRASKKK